MPTAILHLSDLHVKKTAEVSIARTPKLAAALAGLNEEIDAILIIFSGDVAHSGKKEQYAEGRKFIDALTLELRARFKRAQISFFAVPGNHDCDFDDTQNQAREFLLAGVLRSGHSGALEASTLAQLSSHQKAFFEFTSVAETSKPIEPSDYFGSCYSTEVSGFHFAITCVNTALGSSIHEKPGCLYIPLENLQRLPLPKSDYSIAVFHHPYNWLTPDSKKRLQSFAEKHADLILTGHEHVADHYRKSNYAPGTLAYIEGGVLAEDDIARRSSFNVVLVALNRSEELVCEFVWDGEIYEKREVSGGWKSFRKARAVRDFELSQKFGESLLEVGMPFSHPAKPNLTIDDIFITPDAAEFVIKDSNSKNLARSGVVKGRNLIATLIERKKVMVIGRERAEKSTLAKILFRKYYADGYTPVLIEGPHIKKTDEEGVGKLVRKHVEIHYENPKLDLFDQYDKDKVVIIIDDFDQTLELNAKGRLKFLETVTAIYDRVVVLGDDLMRIEEIASGHLASSVVKSFAHFEIKEFGFVLRSQLLDKWYGLNAEYAGDDDVVRKRVQKAERLIDEMMKRSYLPSYPQFILTILQGADAPHGIDSNAGSYGYLYQVLITDKLTSSAKTISLERKLGYLVELAYHMFKRRHAELAETEYRVFHLRYCSDYPPIDQRDIFEALERAGILEVYDLHYRFKYKYFYYYFVAQYFSRHIDEPDIREEIKALCKDFDREEQANIWLFLTHQSRSQFLLDIITDYAKDFFSEVQPVKFDADVSFLDELYQKVPALVYVDKSVEAIREERRERLDREGSEAEDISEAGNLSGRNGSEIIGLIKKLKAAIRTLEIMGQIVKNFAPSLRGDPRYTLVKECYDLGLRVIARCLALWKDSSDEFIGDIIDVVLEKNTTVETKEELEAAIKGFIFYFCETIAVNMVKRVSQAVSASELVSTYAEVYSKTPSRSYRMIDIALKLDNPSFPVGDVFNLNDELDREVFCKRMLARLTVDHFYLYRTRDQLKQQVCSRLGIEMKKFREIDYETNETKRLE